MEAPKPMTLREDFIIIKKELKSEEGNICHLEISFSDSKFNFLIEKKGKIFNEKYKNSYTISQIQENQYLKMFSSPQEILEELKDRIESDSPILNEIKNNNTINLVISVPIKKFKQINFNLLKDNNKINENSNELKALIEKMYEKIEKLENGNKKLVEENQEIKEKNKNIELRLNEIENILKKKVIVNLKKNNFHWIKEEVNIVDQSKFDKNFPPEVMIGKKKQLYSLTEGNRNHFVEFSFIKIYYLKSIRIKVNSRECSLKTFKIEVISPNEERNVIGTFIRKKYNEISGFQEFEVNKECKGIKLYLIDNWGSDGGNFILISEIGFNVSE